MKLIAFFRRFDLFCLFMVYVTLFVATEESETTRLIPHTSLFTFYSLGVTLFRGKYTYIFLTPLHHATEIMHGIGVIFTFTGNIISFAHLVLVSILELFRMYNRTLFPMATCFLYYTLMMIFLFKVFSVVITRYRYQ